MLSAEDLLLLALGYGACVLHVYKSTLSVFFKEYKENTESMKRIHASIHTEVIRRVEDIERSNRKLLELSRTDSLTGLYVKNAIINSLNSHLERSPQTALSVLMIDIDKFKQINDSMGHQIGDRCIKTLSGLIQASFRQDDVLGRYGGDEFMILLPAITPVKAYLIADRFRQQVQSKSVPQFTVSVGISSYPDDAKTSAALIELADKALYASKQRGRNGVTLYSSFKSN
jgi:diguanylate cyclase (GGDEF)-like protein